MQTLKPNQSSHISPNSRRLTAAGALLCLATSAFAQSADTTAQQQSPRRTFSQQGAVGQGQGGFGIGSAGAPGAAGFGQAPARQPTQSTPLPKVPDNLEDLLAQALRSNPEILLAESKLRQVQSELNQVRLKITEEVVSLYHERKKQEELLTQLTQQLDLVRSAFRAGQAPSDKVIDATIARSSAAAAVPQIEAQTRYLLGLGGDAPTSLPTAQSAPHAHPTPTAPRPEIPEKFRQILERPANLPFEDTPASAVFKFLEEDHKIPIFMDAAMHAELPPDAPISFTSTSLPLSQALQAMLDTQFSTPEGTYRMCFVFRDYGILVTTPARAEKLYGATIPPEIPMHPSAVPPDAPQKTDH